MLSSCPSSSHNPLGNPTHTTQIPIYRPVSDVRGELAAPIGGGGGGGGASGANGANKLNVNAQEFTMTSSSGAPAEALSNR